jgi:hypothetical protein
MLKTALDTFRHDFKLVQTNWEPDFEVPCKYNEEGETLILHYEVDTYTCQKITCSKIINKYTGRKDYR